MPHDVVEKLAAVAILHDHVQLFFGLDDLVKLDDVWMSDLLQDFDLSCDTFDILLIMDLIFFQNFNRNLFSSECVLPQFNLAESSFSKMFT